MGNRLTRSLLGGLPAVLIVVAFTSFARMSPAETGEAPSVEAKPALVEKEAADDDGGGEMMLDPLGPNAACYVCHTTFVFEEMARVHLVEKITCIECHGLSAAHANDENIGATKPDITYKHEAIDASCKKCHETHDVPARDVVARFLERALSNSKMVCTDCHGMHRIEHAEENVSEKAPAGSAAESVETVSGPEVSEKTSG